MAEEAQIIKEIVSHADEIGRVLEQLHDTVEALQ
jgi:hypothetical protein